MAPRSPGPIGLDRLLIRPATHEDANAVQIIRKTAWQKRYVHPETGVTEEFVRERVAPLPPTPADLAHYRAMLEDPRNRSRNLVAVIDGEIIGTVTYDTRKDGTGDIGVFVADPWNGTGVGNRLLQTLIAATENDLQVEIFARNPSRFFYREHGFREVGSEGREYFEPDVYLPTQVLKLVRAQSDVSP